MIVLDTNVVSGLPVVNNRGEAQVVTAMHYETVSALVRRL